MGKKQRRVVGFLSLLLLTLVLPSQGASAHSHGRVLARGHLSVQHGGEVHAHGWRLLVPPHTVERGGIGSITAAGKGEFDIHISAPWHGKVAISAPLSGPRDGILHDVGGVWAPEGRRRGQYTVWATQLSVWSTIGEKIKSIPENLCLEFSVSAFVKCVAEKGIKHINSKLATWIESKLPGGCVAHIAENGLLAGGPAGEFIAALTDPACVETASSPGAPSSPAPPKGSTHPPSPAPSPSPSPPGAGGAHPIFTVMNTSETPPDGVWFRNSPHTGDTDRVTGHGVYMGEQVQLLCYGFGDAVGPYNNSLWYDVVDVSRPTNAGRSNSGWLNAHYINDGLVSNQVDAGVTPC